MRHDPAHRELVIFASDDDVDAALIAVGYFGMLADPLKATAVLGTVGRDKWRAPATSIAMHQMGCDLTKLDRRPLTPALLGAADLVVTIGRSGDRSLVPTEPSLYREHWLVPPPQPADGDEFDPAHSTREAIRSRVAMLVFTEGWVSPRISRYEARVTRQRWHAHAPATG